LRTFYSTGNLNKNTESAKAENVTLLLNYRLSLCSSIGMLSED
jgi:hypothetical protein